MASLLAAAPAAARLLSIEVGVAVTAHDQRWHDAARLWRPFGVSLGLENAGGSLHALVDAHGWGLTYLKIDGRFLRGLSQDPDLAEYARQVISTARGIGLEVYAEGMDDPEDLAHLWAIGFDGATGPAVTAAH
jgi:EAL domain-containing protein (putative c-di-GMP-specific phosphodiesterase class I)